MNLLDTTTYRFVSNTTRQYINNCAILSHKWRGDEIDMQTYKGFLRSARQFLNSNNIDQAFVEADDEEAMNRFSAYTAHLDDDQITGIAKILKFCWVAQRDGYRYAWIDTCCIDKTDGRALDKALNSMFDYYASSARCYAYLGDMSIDEGHSDIRESGWFNRGQSKVIRLLIVAS